MLSFGKIDCGSGEQFTFREVNKQNFDSGELKTSKLIHTKHYLPALMILLKSQKYTTITS